MKRIISLMLVLVIMCTSVLFAVSCDSAKKGEWYSRDDGEREYFISVDEKNEEMTVIVSEGKNDTYYVFDCEIDDDEIKIKDAGKNKETYSFKLKEGSSITIDGVKFKSTDDAPDLDDCKKGKNSLTVYELLGKVGEKILVGKYIGKNSMTENTVVEFFGNGTYKIYDGASLKTYEQGEYEISENGISITLINKSGEKNICSYEYYSDGSISIDGELYVPFKDNGESGVATTKRPEKTENDPADTVTPLPGEDPEEVPGDKNGDGKINCTFTVWSDLYMNEDEFEYNTHEVLYGNVSLIGGHTVKEMFEEVIFDFGCEEYSSNSDGDIIGIKLKNGRSYDAESSLLDQNGGDYYGDFYRCYYFNTYWTWYVNGEIVEDIDNYFVSDSDDVQFILSYQKIDEYLDLMFVNVDIDICYDGSRDCYETIFSERIAIGAFGLYQAEIEEMFEILETYDIYINYESKTEINYIEDRRNGDSYETYYVMEQNRPVTGKYMSNGTMEYYYDKVLWDVYVEGSKRKDVLTNDSTLLLSYYRDYDNREKTDFLYP